MTYTIDAQPLWTLQLNVLQQQCMALLMDETNHETYAQLWQWSVDQPEVFDKIWDFAVSLVIPRDAV